MNLVQEQLELKLRNEEERLKKDLKTRFKNYEIDIEQYLFIYKEQEGKCAICDKEFIGNRRPCIDHCHLQGHVRGLLCRSCNWALGHFSDNEKTVISAIKYLFFNKIGRIWWRQNKCGLSYFLERVGKPYGSFEEIDYLCDMNNWDL